MASNATNDIRIDEILGSLQGGFMQQLESLVRAASPGIQQKGVDATIRMAVENVVTSEKDKLESHIYDVVHGALTELLAEPSRLAQPDGSLKTSQHQPQI